MQESVTSEGVLVLVEGQESEPAFLALREACWQWEGGKEFLLTSWRPGMKDAFKSVPGMPAEPPKCVVLHGGRVVGTFPKLPSGPELMEMLQGAGWRPLEERLRPFLEQHPDHTEGRMQMLLAARRMRASQFWDRQAPRETQRGAGPLREAFKGLTAMSHVQWAAHPLLFADFDGPSSRKAWTPSAEVRADLTSVLDGLMARLAQEAARQPGWGDLYSAWSTLAFYGEHLDPSDFISGLRLSPAERVEPMPFLDELFRPALERGRPDLMLKASKAAEVWLDDQMRTSFPGTDPKGQRALRARIGKYQVLALCLLGKRDEAQGVGERLHHQTAESWKHVASWLRAQAGEVKDPDQKAWLRLLAERPVGGSVDSVEATCWELRVSERSWPGAIQDALKAWTPKELKVVTLAGGSAWKLVNPLGQTLAEGDLSAPAQAQHLLSTLRAQVPSLLHRRQAFLDQHPDHTQGHLDMVVDLQRRMPSPSLEAMLLDHAAVGLAAPDVKDGWAPGEAWGPAVERGLKVMAERVAWFPGDLRAWRGLLGWSRIGRVPVDLVRVAEELPTWYRDPIWYAARIPPEIFERLLEQCAARQQWSRVLELYARRHPSGASLIAPVRPRVQALVAEARKALGMA